MSDLNVNIDFSSNAAVVQQQIKDLNRQVHLMESNVQRLSTSLDRGKATSKALTGDIRGRTTILKLDKQIAAVAEQRVKQATKGYNFGAQDRYVKGLMKTNEIMRIQRKIMDDNATAMINLGKNTQWAGRQLVVGFTVPLTIAAGAAMKAFSDLEKEMVRFKRVYGDAFTSTAEITKMANEVKGLATEWTKYGVAVSDTAQMAAEAAGAGFKGDKLIAQINAATKTAVLGELDKQKAMKATIALQSTFAMSNEELAQSINYLNQLENQTMVTMDDMTTAIPKAATVVQGLGGDIQDLGTFMAAMAEGGVSAAEGANALKSGLGSLLNPSKKAAEELASIGIVMEDLWAKSEQNGGGVLYVVEQMAVAMERLGQTQKQMVIEELFGKHQFARMNALLSNINKGTQALQAKDVAGTSQLEAAMIAQRELGKLGESSLTKFQASLQSLKAQIAPIGEQIMKAITPFIEGASKIIEWFNKLPDTFKNAGLLMVAGIGIVTPILLMLVGQIQNLMGNGMKLINTLRNLGKNTQWVAAENLTLADSLTKVDMQLIAENKLLMENTRLWQARGGAAAGSVIGPKPKVRRKFATGGEVPGTGNRDTVPAMLTPGEFVVNKQASKVFGGLLDKINSGRVQGFEDGGMVRAHLTAPRQGVPTGGTFSPSERKRLTMFSKRVSSFGLDPNMFMSSVSNLTRPLPAEVNAALNSKKGIPANELMKYFSARKVNAKNQPMAQALWSAGVDPKRISRGDFVGGQKQFDSTLRSMLRARGAKPITDKDLYVIVERVLLSMAKSGKHPEFVGQMGRAGSQIGQSRTIRATELMTVAQKHGHTNLYDLLLRDSGSGKGPRSYSMKGAKSFRSWGNSAFSKALGFFAAGGMVPGKGNKDTVPAMLTPGESVINKEASKQFGPLLQAINAGKLRMFGDGEVRIDKGAPTPIRNMVKENFFSKESLEAAAHIMAKTFGMDVAKILPAALEDYEKGPVAAHHKGTIDPATGKKIYPSSQVISDSAVVNNLMEQSSPEKSRKNFDGLLKASQELTKEMLESGHSLNDVQKVQERHARVLGQLADGQHVMVKEDRKILATLGNRAVANGRMSENYGSMLSASMPALGLGVRNAQGQVVTRKVQRQMRSDWEAGAASGQWVGTRAGAVKSDEIDAVAKGSTRRFDPMSLMFAMSMFGTEISGVTDKLGGFGTALTSALTAFSMANMMGIPTPMGGGVKGILGKGTVAAGKVGIAAKYAKFGGMAGGVGGLLGGLAGNFIGDKIGGAAGSAVKWGATGAGIGMMFGPWGAAIGGAVGALAGFTVQVKASRDAQKKAVKTMEEAAAAYQNIGKQLEEKYQVGGNIGMGEYISGVASMTEQQAQLYEQLKMDMMATDGPWKSRINDLIAAQEKGTYGGAQNELNSLTMQLRGQGVDEDSIDIIVKAFAESLPAALRGALVPSAVTPQSTDAILASVDTKNVAGAGSLLTTTLMSLNDQLLNLDKNSKTYAADQAKLNAQIVKTKSLLNQTQTNAGPDQFKRIVGAGVVNLIKTNQGAGLDENEWKTIQDGFDGNQAELSIAAQALMQAGFDLSGMAGAQVMALQGALKGMADQKAIIDEQTAINTKAKSDLAALNNAKATKDSELAANKGKIALEESGKALDIKGAKLEIAQLNIEKSALDKFKKEFNKAFGTSIDSFADAQFQIDKIGNRIQRINLKVIAPLQEKVDDLNRMNELAQRRLADLEEAKQERIDAINESYDKQAKALERIRQQNEYIANQQKANIALSDALSKGDLAGAAGAMVTSAQNQAQYSATLSDQRLADARDAAITNDPANAEIDKLKAQIEARSDKILAIEDKIYNINEKQIEPLQRRSDLMSLMLSTSKLIMENQKANANGLDAENFAREQALHSAKESLFEAKNRLTTEDEIVQRYKDQREAIIKANEAQRKGTETIEQTLARMIKSSDTAIKTAKADLELLTGAAIAFATGMEEGVKYLQEKAPVNSAAHAVLAAVMATNPEAYKATGGKDAVKAATKSVQPDRSGDFGYQRPQPNGDFGYVRRSTGGTVPGSGGRDNVPALLTPGEFVMRKSAVDRLGVENLRRANQGVTPETNALSVGKYAKGGLVGANFLGVFGDKILEEFASNLGVAGSTSSTGSTGKVNIDSPSSPAPKSGARGAAGAVDYLLTRLGKSSVPLAGLDSVLNKCLSLVGNLYTRYVGSKSAPSAAGPIQRIAGMKRAGIQFHSGYDAPKGAMYWYGGGQYGHVGYADGKGNIVGNYGGNYVEKRGAQLGGRKYYGWTTKMANGGLVPGSSNYDSVGAALMPGEFVLNRNAVKTIGTAPLRALNEGKVSGVAPSRVTYPDVNGDGGTVVYNNYDLAFTVNDASDPYEVANVIVRQFERATKSKVRKR
jgi:TP901 family phage tail tape measure protein